MKKSHKLIKEQQSIEWEPLKKLAKLFFSPLAMVIIGFATYYFISVYFNYHWILGFILGFAAYFLTGMLLFPEMNGMSEDLEEYLKIKS